MPVINLTQLRAVLPAGARLLGLDPGGQRIGVALSDVEWRLAGPYATLRRGKLAANAAEILAIARREGAGGLLIGLPLRADGTVGPAAQAARDWAHALSAATLLPAALWDERFSTTTVQDVLAGEAGLGHRRRAEVVDRAAAAHILQSALDALR